MKAMYLRTYDTTDDNMTNAEYITYTAEPKYTLIVALTKVLTGDVLRCVLEYTDQTITDEEISARTHRRLYASIMDGNFVDFKFIYDNEYIMNSCAFAWFEFGEEWYDSVWNFYPMCECWCTDYNCKSCDPVKVYRDLYVQRCRCENGKRYLAFRMIYDEAYEFITVCVKDSDKDKDNKKKKKQQQEKNPSQQIADYIIASGPIILDHSLILNR